MSLGHLSGPYDGTVPLQTSLVTVTVDPMMEKIGHRPETWSLVHESPPLVVKVDRALDRLHVAHVATDELKSWNREESGAGKCFHGNASATVDQ